MKRNWLNISGYAMMVMFCVGVVSCKKFIEIPAPKTQLVQQAVFDDDATAQAAMAGVYIKLADGESFADGGFNSVSLLAGLYTDELVSFSSSTGNSARADFYFNNVTPLNEAVSANWDRLYKVIYECNRIMEGLGGSSGVSPALKNQLIGEASFIRSFCHFYLVNLFGDAPLILNADYRQNTSIGRSSITDIYASIATDLNNAKDLLSDNYPSTGRVRVNKGAAIAMLSRIHLYLNNYQAAENLATEIIGKSAQYKIENSLDGVFLANSEEAIWQLLPKGGAQKYTNDGSIYILLAPPTTNWSLREEIVNVFESGDRRRQKWIGTIQSSSGITTWYYPYKYKENQLNANGLENSMVLRLGEQYLIRAEARANLNKLSGNNSAESDLNVIRNRAGLPNTTATTKEQLLQAIQEERRKEFFTEWGHRFFDLKRTGRLNSVMQSTKSNWKAFQALLPLPLLELQTNRNLKQNPGY